MSRATVRSVSGKLLELFLSTLKLLPTKLQLPNLCMALQTVEKLELPSHERIPFFQRAFSSTVQDIIKGEFSSNPAGFFKELLDFAYFKNILGYEAVCGIKLTSRSSHQDNPFYEELITCLVNSVLSVVTSKAAEMHLNEWKAARMFRFTRHILTSSDSAHQPTPPLFGLARLSAYVFVHGRHPID